jgi:diguanylate cyclase (GGDEF)-like protein
MHPILVRQLKRFLGTPSVASSAAAFDQLRAFLEGRLAPPELQQLGQGLATFVARVNDAYAQFDRDLALLSRSLHLSSQELLDINQELHSTLKARETAIDRLQGLALRLRQTLPAVVEPEAGGDDNLASLIGLIAHLVERQEAHQAELLAMHTNLATRTAEVLAANTALRASHERIEFQAYHDALTGLPNRALGQDRLGHLLAHASRHQTSLAVLYLDLDRFKYINDTHGHVQGDRLLQRVAQRLTHGLGADDTLCRLSADEFMMLMPEPRSPHLLPDIAKRCEALLASLAEPFDLEGRQLHTTFSLGLAVYPQDGADGETLMRNADTALFEAKRAGRQTYRFFEPRMNDELIRLIQTRDALREALVRHEFELHYQPQLDLRSKRVVGVESLIRWRRPGMGLLLPGAFIDVAEETGLVIPIGRWVLGEACRQAAAWRAAGWQGLVMAVNISPAQFRQGELQQDVLAALDASGLDPAGLDLELTESLLLQGEASVLEIIGQWKARGIQLSIDDFGTGYSNLAYLKRFKVDKLKIDRSFIINLLDDEEDRAIVQAMIQIARSFNIRTIAEGVEDRTQAEQLKIMGCDEVQGYLYSRPLPATELTQWLTAVASA